MIDSALTALIEQYRTGLEAELSLLDRLRDIATRQRIASENADFEALGIAGEQRDDIMSALVTIEHELKPIRLSLHARRDELDGEIEFEAVAALHRHAGQRVADILAGDEKALAALKDAERARRFAAKAIEQGESTLAAYRRVVAPAPSHATLFNRRG